MKNKRIKLNLGCLITKKEGYLNVDINPKANPDLIMNLDEDKFNLQGNSVSEVVAIHIFEHLSDPLFALKELYRVCKNGAKIYINVPHGFSVGYCMDLTHHSRFTYLSFDYLAVDEKGDYKNPLHNEYGEMKFKVKKKFKSRKWMRWFDLIWNRFPTLYEFYLIGIFPATELIFELEVVKLTPNFNLK